MPYELDTDSTENTDAQPDETDTTASEPSLGIPIPDDHVGAFVAQALEDPERSTDWDDVVDALVAPSARDAWDRLSPVEQATEVLSKAAEFDRRAIEQFDAVPLNAERTAVQADIDEGLRCRRNADTFRDGVAAAYDSGRLDDDDIVEALSEAAFETDLIAKREDLLERLDGAFDIEFRPYGGTLMDDDDGPEPDTDHGETW